MNTKIPRTGRLSRRVGTGFHRVCVYCYKCTVPSLKQKYTAGLAIDAVGDNTLIEGLRAVAYYDKQTVEKMRRPCLPDISRER